ncbi:hypothetical protein R5R35_011888 [Gryllus longicercus]|uniref:Uncharacterized protein n=1 Tax=Gryllus longicercus TaxID=2509291 RepID=A0AAN9VW75_9ORTH
MLQTSSAPLFCNLPASVIATDVLICTFPQTRRVESPHYSYFLPLPRPAHHPPALPLRPRPRATAPPRTSRALSASLGRPAPLHRRCRRPRCDAHAAYTFRTPAFDLLRPQIRSAARQKHEATESRERLS